MSTKESDAVEGIDLSTERAARALTECMSVLPNGGDVYTVVSESGSTYAVDAREGRCDCPDAEHNLADDEACKHEIRALVATGGVTLPAFVDLSAADEQLGQHVEGGPKVAAADGGAVVAGETDDITDERPVECECSGADDVCACWPCYAAGYDFADPNPAAGDDDESAGEVA